MKAMSLLLLAIGLAAAARGDIADRWIERGRQAQASFDSQAALAAYLKADIARPNDPVILQAIARQYSDMTMDTTDRTEQVRRAEAALGYAKRALALAPGSAVATLSVAICYGRLGTYGDIGTRIADARLVKTYADRALALDPNYDFAHDVLGEWHTRVAALGQARRLVVDLVYGGLPAASTQTGVEELQKAVALAPDCPTHWAGLGLAYLANGQPDRAKLALEHALALPARERVDGESQLRAREALGRIG
jgi:tetratricopeptide (TPR) repeat protein